MDSCIVKTTEERLLNEADSLGGLMAPFRKRVSPRLIGDSEWETILDCARGLPVTLASVPFGFELPLHDVGPRADFFASVVAGGKSGPFFGEGRPSQDPGASAPRLGRMLDEMARQESPLRRIVGPKLLLEYDAGTASGHAVPAPGLFLYPVETAFPGNGAERRLLDLVSVLDALDDASCWQADAAEREQIMRTYTALSPEACIGGIGAFPSRGRGIRLTLRGFKTADEVAVFLERAGRTEQHAAINSIISFLEARKAFTNIWVHFDMLASGIGPKLGLSFAQDRECTPEGARWTALIDSLREQGLAVPEKLAELAQWSSGPEMLLGRSGGYVLVPYIHHIKYVLAGSRIEQIKAYAVWLLYFPSEESSRTP